MTNAIYLFIAILMFIAWVANVSTEKHPSKYVKRFHFIMQIIFFIANIICFILVRENEFFKHSGKAIISAGYIVFGIPIIIYIVDLIVLLIIKEHFSSGLTIILWGFYIIFLFSLCVRSSDACIKSENVMQERENLVSYKEVLVTSSFLSNSVQRIDYMVKKQNSSGGEENEIIQTREYMTSSLPKVKVEVYSHQEKSYIEKYCVVNLYYIFYFYILYY